MHGVEVVHAFFMAHGLSGAREGELAIAPEIPSRNSVVSVIMEDVRSMLPNDTTGMCEIPGNRLGRVFLRALLPQPALIQPKLHMMADEIEARGVLTDTQLSTLVHQWAILEQEFPDIISSFEHDCASTHVGLESAWRAAYPLFRQALYDLECKYATAVRECKLKDDVRGNHIIPDYNDVNEAIQEQLADHTGEGLDAVMLDAFDRAQKFQV